MGPAARDGGRARGLARREVRAQSRGDGGCRLGPAPSPPSPSPTGSGRDRRLEEFLLSAWPRLTGPEQVAIRSLLHPDLGPLESILFEDGSHLTDEPVAAWIWPVVRKLCGADSKHRRNVLNAAWRHPESVTDDFRTHLLAPVLAGRDLASVAPTACATLQFALAIRDGHGADYPAAGGRELEAARLWLPVLDTGNRTARKAPPLRRLDQPPDALLYGRALDPFPPEPTGAFWVDWLRMIATDDRVLFRACVEAAGIHKQAFWRFAAGWDSVAHLLKYEIEKIIKEGLLDEYLRAVLSGAPLPLDVSREVDEVAVRNACETPDQCRAVYLRCRDTGDDAVGFRFWKHCLDVMSEATLGDLDRVVHRSAYRKILSMFSNRMSSNRESDHGWLGLAFDIYRSSTEKVRHAMDQETRQRLGNA